MSTVTIWQTISTGSADTEKLGELLGKQLAGGEVIVLRSDLGGGKTTFVRGLARGAGSPDRVASPTFTLNKVYQAGKLQIHHFDFYRLSDPGIMSEQLAESLDDPEVVTVVEWENIVSGILPQDKLIIEFKPVKDNPDERQISISYPEAMEVVIKRLETDFAEAKP